MAPEKPVANSNGADEADLAKVRSDSSAECKLTPKLTLTSPGIPGASERRTDCERAGEPAHSYGGTY